MRERLRGPHEAVADPNVQWSASGDAAVHFRHMVHGIPVFLAASTVRFGADGEVAVTGDIDEEAGFDPRPQLDATAALIVATRHLAGTGERAADCDEPHEEFVVPRRYRPRIVAAFPLPSRPTVFSRGPYAQHVRAELTVHEQGLAWLITAYPSEHDQHLLLVDARDGAVLFCRRNTPRGCTGSVLLFDPNRARELVSFPCDPAFFPAALQAQAAGAMFRWMENDRTFGNNAGTFWNNSQQHLRAARQGQNLVFADAAPADSRDQYLLNAFFFCNFIHDFFELLGFTDADGAFHQVNRGTAGTPRDRLEIRVTDQPFRDLGSMDAANDGDTPRLTLGRDPVTRRHAALDPAVVIHEYVHGVTKRLIGGRHNAHALVLRQSQALGEAYSDFFAITIQNYLRFRRGIAAEEYVFARWSTNGTIRTGSYDGFTARYGAAGTAPRQRVHTAGEIWAAAAIQFARRLVALQGTEAGSLLAWRIVFQSWRELTTPNPNFIDAREAVFTAIARLGAGIAVLDEARESFRARGMGRLARGGKADRWEQVESTDPF